MLELVTLTGTLVRLESLAMHHAEDLATTTQDPQTWLYHGAGDLTDRADLEAFILSVQDEPELGIGLNFAIVRQLPTEAV
ncbi:MAG: hypothetical protein H8F28_00035 [Fibrella sp.]|nr:hypothetical protein [Armatimonadota bacterium]